jgi:hypothetical protein
MSGKGKSGGAKKSTTKRDTTIAFVGFFSVFFLVGYLRGRSDRDSPDRLKLYLLGHCGVGSYDAGRATRR